MRSRELVPDASAAPGHRGFGTFRDPVILDFTDADYFALVGPTGSGKTTVIDAICFALYGAAPRWPRRNQVSLAMAPSASFTRVSLIFAVGGRQYAAVRALVKSARGQVTTKQSRLITLPAEIDLTGDLGELLGEELESIAEAPPEMDRAIARILGLSYDHFIQTVVLPQGEFANFLHAEKNKRQDLLVSLLGLSVYQQVMQRANSIAKEANVRADTWRGDLDQYADATAEAEEAAGAQLHTLSEFQAGLPPLLTPWKAAARAFEAAAQAAASQDADIQALAAIQAPDDLDSVAAERMDAMKACTDAAHAVAEAEQAELAADHAVEEAGQPAEWKQLIAVHDQIGTARDQHAIVVEIVADTAAQLEQATTERQRAAQELDQARATLEQVQNSHAADHLAQSLLPGAECPVCRQVVSTVPDRPPHEGLAEARSRIDEAERALKSADAGRSSAQRSHDRAVNDQDRIAERLAELEAQTKDRPSPEAAAKAYQAALDAETAWAKARREARTAREKQRAADERAKTLEQRWADAGRQLMVARDGVGHLTPPPTTGDHVRDWSSLVAWATAKVTKLRAQAEEATAVREAAAGHEAAQQKVVSDHLGDHGIETPSPFTEVSVTAAVAVAVANAKSEVNRIKSRREQAAGLQRRIADQEGSEQLHRELGNLLSARNFERWMVEEALRAMMIEASETLTELSGGQFELTLDDKQDILVIDHNDSSSQRPVQTLSGARPSRPRWLWPLR